MNIEETCHLTFLCRNVFVKLKIHKTWRIILCGHVTHEHYKLCAKVWKISYPRDLIPVQWAQIQKPVSFYQTYFGNTGELSPKNMLSYTWSLSCLSFWQHIWRITCLLLILAYLYLLCLTNRSCALLAPANQGANLSLWIVVLLTEFIHWNCLLH